MMKVDGLEKLNRQLARISVETKADIRKALDKGAEEMAAMVRTLAPVDDGQLQASIQVEDGRHGLAVRVAAGGDDAPYARIIEFGNDEIPARPYFWPGYRAVKKRIRGRISRAVNTGAKKAAEK